MRTSLDFPCLLCHTVSMQKRISRPTDINQGAFQMVRHLTGTEDRQSRAPRITSSDISRVMSAMGRKGGKVGGKRRMVTMTPEQRKNVARNAAQTRWAKRNSGQ